MNIKEFFIKWKKGIEQITQLQQTRIQINSTWIVLIGISLGIWIVGFYTEKSQWWLLVILIGSLGNVIPQQVALYQKKWAYEEIEKTLKELT